MSRDVYGNMKKGYYIMHENFLLNHININYEKTIKLLDPSADGRVDSCVNIDFLRQSDC